MRIPVSLIIILVANGMTRQDMVEGYPDLEEDIKQALEYSSWLAYEEAHSHTGVNA
jgi:uncharacterized protein (DUF433 family)